MTQNIVSVKAPEGPLLVVSPHLDDAVLSCAALLDRGESVDVLNIFGGEPDPPRQGEWDRRCGSVDSASSAAIRKREDQAAFAGTRHAVTTLSLLDWQYIERDRGPDDHQAIERAVDAWCSSAGVGAVALPVGAGRRVGRLLAPFGRLLDRLGPTAHPDHDLVRDAGLRVVARQPLVTAMLYEELPYLFGRGADAEVIGITTSSPWTVRVLELPVDRSAKAARVAAYASQVPFLCRDGLRLDRAENLPPTERYWLLNPARSNGAVSPSRDLAHR